MAFRREPEIDFAYVFRRWERQVIAAYSRGR
jgi:hypothetical protein